MDNEKNNVPAIFDALQRVNEEISAIAKKSNGQFRAQRIEDILNQIHPLFSTYGIVIGSKVISRERYEFTVGKDQKLQFWVQATYEFRFTSTLDGSEFLVTEDGEGNDFSDKAGNKAKSYALKYALIRLFTLPCEDLDDGDKTPTTPVTKPKAKPRPQMITAEQNKKIHATCGSTMDYKVELAGFLNIDPEKVPSTKAMTKVTASKFIEYLVKQEGKLNGKA